MDNLHYSFPVITAYFFFFLFIIQTIRLDNFKRLANRRPKIIRFRHKEITGK